ncbi:MAG TPA: S8 family peptidase [Vicinamibacterales bacterium]|nr:S8 family peptidase [Vicinamibacterales bacterium]
MRLALALALVCGIAQPALAGGPGGSKGNNNSSGSGSAAFRKLDRALARRAKEGRNRDIRVIIELVDASDGGDTVKNVRGRAGRRLHAFNGRVAYVSEKMLEKLADHPLVKSVHVDRPTQGELNRTAVSIGARYVQTDMGYTGAGVGVAVLDSGITSWHDDLTNNGSGQRVVKFVDFVNNRAMAYDDNGHGTHVAGIIAGNGYDSYGAHAGMAPRAHLVGLKVLDENGGGYISDVIAALDWVIANKSAYNIRVANLSVGAAVTTSYNNDPLTLAAKRAVEAGVVVVTAAGNLGKNPYGRIQYGGITAPGNAPWVLTVGASSHEGTTSRSDDEMGMYSSRGPTAVDFSAKPDVVAPGTGTVSLADPTSKFYVTKALSLVSGSRLLGYKPYLALTGTSMASPVVAGTVALMLQANPSLTPNAVKAILQYTSQPLLGVNYLTQGAGSVNARGAVALAEYYAHSSGVPYPSTSSWSKHIIWGNKRVRGGKLKPTSSAFATNIVWGTRKTQGLNIVWGTLEAGENIVWGTADSAENIVWGTLAGGENIVWGTDCGGNNCTNVVWGTVGSRDGENIVWGTADTLENIVWGTADSGENIVWGTADALENIVWGTASGENIVWGTSSGYEDDVTWASNGDEDTPLYDDPDAPPVLIDSHEFDEVLELLPVTEPLPLGGVL